jgi:hypothetical protein
MQRLLQKAAAGEAASAAPTARPAVGSPHRAAATADGASAPLPDCTAPAS